MCAAAAAVPIAHAGASPRVADHGVCPGSAAAAAVAANHSSAAAVDPAALDPAALGPAALGPPALGPAAWQDSNGGVTWDCAVAVVLMLAGCTADQ